MRDDETPLPAPTTHLLGQDLSRLSIEELDARIALLKSEIVRLEQAMSTKQASREAAEGVFRF